MQLLLFLSLLPQNFLSFPSLNFTTKMPKSYCLLPLAFFTVLFLHEAMARIPIDSKWHDAHATFYGDMSGGETMRK